MKRPPIVTLLIAFLAILLFIGYCAGRSVYHRPTPTPTPAQPTITPIPDYTSTPVPTSIPTNSPTFTPSPSNTPTATNTPLPTNTPSATPTNSPTPVPTYVIIESPTPDLVDTIQIVGGVFHNIVRGDTLWDLAAFYYNDPFLWPVICEENKLNPCWLIHAGNTLYIPEMEADNVNR